jgi:hypothetical protein
MDTKKVIFLEEPNIEVISTEEDPSEEYDVYASCAAGSCAGPPVIIS